MVAQKYSQKTIKTRYCVCNLIFKYAMLQGLYSHNPCTDLKIPRGVPPIKRALPSQAEIEKIINAVNDPFGLFAYFLIYTGCRRGEALALTYKDIDFKNRVIHINKNLHHEGNKPVIESHTKTAAGVRDIPLVKPLESALTPGKGYVFGGERPLTSSQFRSAWKKYCSDNNINVIPHQLRHYFATVLYDANVSIKSAQKILGHSDFKTTMNIYTHISDIRGQSDKSKLDDFFSLNSQKYSQKSRKRCKSL